MNAFWSVTMYDSKTQLLIKNPPANVTEFSVEGVVAKVVANASRNCTKQHQAPRIPL